MVKPRIVSFLNAIRAWLLCLCLTAGPSWHPGCAAQELPSPPEDKVETVKIERGSLSALFRDNSQSPRVLSGIDSLFGARGYAVLFFANYMNDVAEVPIHFRGIEQAGAPEKWIRAEAPPGHPDYSTGGTYRSAVTEGLQYDQDHNFKLNLWSYDYPRFTQPSTVCLCLIGLGAGIFCVRKRLQ
ncbi:MAG: hypothetical protein HY735_21730 [Verrucomicrobia bacterium]|nr:hypothetical protein [Verrucomicrobiota bacterium]